MKSHSTPCEDFNYLRRIVYKAVRSRYHIHSDLYKNDFTPHSVKILIRNGVIKEKNRDKIYWWGNR